MLCDEVHPQTSETTSTEQALNRLAREIALDIATCLKDMFLWVRSQGKCLSSAGRGDTRARILLRLAAGYVDRILPQRHW